MTLWPYGTPRIGVCYRINSERGEDVRIQLRTRAYESLAVEVRAQGRLVWQMPHCAVGCYDDPYIIDPILGLHDCS